MATVGNSTVMLLRLILTVKHASNDAFLFLCVSSLPCNIVSRDSEMVCSRLSQWLSTSLRFHFFALGLTLAGPHTILLVAIEAPMCYHQYFGFVFSSLLNLSVVLQTSCLQPRFFFETNADREHQRRKFGCPLRFTIRLIP